MRRLLILPVATMMVLFFVSLAFAPTDPIPHLINYQGMLTNDEGTPLDGNYYLTFKIYDQLTSGAVLWTEIHSPVSVENGLFSVTLGNGTSWSTGIPSDVFDGAERYLGTKVGTDPGEPELSPRVRLTSVAYAYLAETAVTAGSDGDWTISDNDIYSAVTGNVGIGTTSPGYRLEIIGSPDVFKAGTSNAWITMRTMGNSTINFGDGDDGERAGFISGDENASGENVLVIAGCDDAGNCPRYTYFHESGNVGIGTNSPSERLEVNGNVKISGTIMGQVPGVGTLVGQTAVTIPTTATALISKSIDAPGAGQVIAMCTGSVYLGGLADGNNYMIRLKLNQGTSTSTTEDGYVIFIRDTYTNQGMRGVPFAVSRVFEATSAGTFTVNLTGLLQIEPASYTSIALDDRVLTLLYVPTTY